MKRYPVWLVFARTTRHVCFAGRRFVIGIFLSFTFSPFCQPLLFSTFVVVTIASPLATTGLVFPYCRLSLNWITWFFIVQLHCVECRLYGPHPCCHLFDTSHFCLGIFFFLLRALVFYGQVHWEPSCITELYDLERTYEGPIYTNQPNTRVAVEKGRFSCFSIIGHFLAHTFYPVEIRRRSLLPELFVFNSHRWHDASDYELYVISFFWITYLTKTSGILHPLNMVDRNSGFEHSLDPLSQRC